MTFMKSIRFRASTKVTSDGNDILNTRGGQGNFTNTRGHESYTENPLPRTYDQPTKRKLRGKIVFLLLPVICVVLALAPAPAIKIQDSNSVWSDKGVVASDDARCSEVGVSMLKLGGHAVDAAIATTLCVGVVNPTESGIGGGAFMVIRDASTSKAMAFDMRETAPAAAYKHMYDKNPQDQIEGPLSMAVPGELKGLHEAWEKYGRLPWKTLFEPAIKYAKHGFEIYPYLSNDMKGSEEKIMADPGLRRVFAPKGKILKQGDTCYNIRLAKTLEAVAEDGPEVFYNGWVGKDLVADVKGGILTMEDLRNYKVNVTDVLEVDIINGYKILGMPPPSSGTLGLAMIANVLSNYKKLDGALGSHRLVEAMKHMLGIRMNLGDPAFDNVSKWISKMTSPSFAKEIWNKIDDDKTFPPQYYEDSWKQIIDGGTSHLGVVDKERNAVALTASVNDIFGAKMLSPSTGIVINNQMRDFSTPIEIGRPIFLPAATSNLIAPGKRPLSSMSPIILLKKGQLAGVMGGSGGTNIIAAVTQVFINRFVLQMNDLFAVDSARVFPKLNEKDLDYENVTVIDGKHIEVRKYKREFLEERGHELNVLGFEPASHLIVHTQGWRSSYVTAVSDQRKDAKPAAE